MSFQDSRALAVWNQHSLDFALFCKRNPNTLGLLLVDHKVWENVFPSSFSHISLYLVLEGSVSCIFTKIRLTLV